MIATTQNQSARLLDCGVSPDTSDMVLFTYTKDGRTESILCTKDYEAVMFVMTQEKRDYTASYAWSLSALLSVLPKSIRDFRMTKWYDPNADGFSICDIPSPYQLDGDFQLLYYSGDWDAYEVGYNWGIRRKHGLSASNESKR